MGNIPIPFNNSRLNSWAIDKKLLIWKTVSMSACIIGSVIYLGPLEPYIEVPIFGILVPTFMIGYIIIHSSDIFLLIMGEDYVFLETCFYVIGALGNLTCGIYQLCKWINWILETSQDSDSDYDVPEVMLALVLFLHFTSLTAVMIHRFLFWRQFMITEAECSI
nr:uncharacterized protein LOC117604568 isoform X1 [Osmia lignaria]